MIDLRFLEGGSGSNVSIEGLLLARCSWNIAAVDEELSLGLMGAGDKKSLSADGYGKLVKGLAALFNFEETVEKFGVESALVRRFIPIYFKSVRYYIVTYLGAKSIVF